MLSAVLKNRASLPLDAACLRKPLTMIDSSKKQQQGFPEILTAEDFEPFKEKECLEGSNQKSLKEGQSVSGHGQDGHARIPVTLAAGMPVCLPRLSAYHPCVCCLFTVTLALFKFCVVTAAFKERVLTDSNSSGLQ